MDGRHEYLKVPEVAEVLRIGRSVRVNRRELDRWLEGQRYMDIMKN